MTAPAPTPFDIDLPEDHRGPVRVRVRHRGAVVADLTCAMGDGPSGDRSHPGAEPAADAAGPLEPLARRRQIFDAACDVIAQRGFAAVTMRDVARAAGAPIGTLYRHVGSKDELLYRITRDCMQELFDYFEAKLLHEGSPSDRLADAVRAYVAYISDNHRYINLVYRETKSLNEQHRSDIYEIERRFMGLWAAIIGDGVAGGEFGTGDVDLAANLAYFTCTVWALRHWSIGDRTEAQVGDMLIQLIVGGLRAGAAMPPGMESARRARRPRRRTSAP